MLKNFPVNGSSLKNNSEKNTEKSVEKSQIISTKDAKIAILSEITEIKQEIFDKKPKEDDLELRLLGDLLRFLRENRLMSVLMICRQIQKIKIEDNVAVIYSDDKQVEEIVKNEKYRAEIDVFFKQKGLGFKLYEKPQTVSAVDILNEMLGGKLIVK